MNANEDRTDVLVIGGGLAGLTAAATAARAGARVRLLERGLTLGGRARTRDEGAYRLNYGAHALYRGGPAMRVLEALNIAPDGEAPDLNNTFAVFDGRLELLPINTLTLARSGLFNTADKIDFGRAYAKLADGAANARAGESLADALGRMTSRPRVLAMLNALVRLATYANAPDELDAAAVFEQARMAKGGVLYLDDGWSQLVDVLAARAEEAGVEIETEAVVASVQRRDEVWRIEMANGDASVARFVILAVEPDVAAQLAPHASSLKRAAENARPARAVTLDIGLSRLPRPDRTFALGVDSPTYFSVHSNIARLAPEGGALVHVARYLGPDEAPAPEMLAELETLLDLVQPGWREHLAAEQKLAGAVVSFDTPRAAAGGFKGRQPVDVGEGLFVAGDWVSDEGLLSDAAFASGAEAGRAAAAARWKDAA
ncbi:MAG: FAD-dependent oxidoreductase [Maricaulaceae bacterium]